MNLIDAVWEGIKTVLTWIKIFVTQFPEAIGISSAAILVIVVIIIFRLIKKK